MKTHAQARKAGGGLQRAPLAALTSPGPLTTSARVRQIVGAPRVQAKLTAGSLGETYEREADRVADAVMRMPEAEAQALQAKEAPGRIPQVTPEIEGRIGALRGSASPLPASERAFFEPRFGSDFGGVRVHTSEEAGDIARRVQARAFTVGRLVAFAKGEYQPGTETGRRLLAHELVHVQQQSAESHSVGRTRQPDQVIAPQRNLSPSQLLIDAKDCALDKVSGGEVTNETDTSWWVSGQSNTQGRHFFLLESGENSDDVASIYNGLCGDVDAVWPNGKCLGPPDQKESSGAFKVEDLRNANIEGSASAGYTISDYETYFSATTLPGWSMPVEIANPQVPCPSAQALTRPASSSITPLDALKVAMPVPTEPLKRGTR